MPHGNKAFLGTVTIVELAFVATVSNYMKHYSLLANS